MIKFDPNKPKKLNMTMQLEGINTEKVSFEFVININEIKYSFPVKSNGLRLNIEVPELNSIVKHEIKNGEYSALVEAKIPTENSKGYYIKPWEDKILIESIPEIKLQLESDTIDEKEIKVVIEEVEIKEEIKKQPVIVEKEEKKEEEIKIEKRNSAFSKFINK